VATPRANVGAITLFVGDPAQSKAFYENVFGAPLVHEDGSAVAFRFENTIVNLLQRSEAVELVEPAAVAPADAGSQLQLTVWVEDADEACRGLAARGVELLNGPIDRPWGVRTAAFADPDGHVWELAQQLS
jgi:catechol 2,3-dioxygenase-like lactoylglutathione lyase family enzyme